MHLRERRAFFPRRITPVAAPNRRRLKRRTAPLARQMIGIRTGHDSGETNQSAPFLEITSFTDRLADAFSSSRGYPIRSKS